MGLNLFEVRSTSKCSGLVSMLSTRPSRRGPDVGGGKLGVAKPGLLLNQNACDPHVPGHERTEGQSEIVQYAL
jgi:hypothetical protein